MQPDDAKTFACWVVREHLLNANTNQTSQSVAWPDWDRFTNYFSARERLDFFCNLLRIVILDLEFDRVFVFLPPNLKIRS